MSDLYIHGGVALVMDGAATVLSEAVLHARDGKIVSLKSDPAFRVPAGAESLDARGALILPGFINGHMHLGMTLFRGLGADLPLHDWLEKAIFPVEQKLCSEEMVRAGTRVACLELIRCGTTTVNDMYYFGTTTASVLAEAGLRGIVGQAITESSQPDGVTLDDIPRFIDEMKRFPLLTPGLAPHSCYTVSRGTWEKIVRMAADRGLRVNTHLSETRQEVEGCLKQYGVRPPEFFEKLGLWETGLAAAAHCVVLDDKDIALLGRRKIGVMHNSHSNLKLASGLAPIAALRKAGARIAIGTDGTASNDSLDIVGEANTAAKAQTLLSGVGSWKAIDTVRALTSEGAAALGLAKEIGSLEVGKSADVVVLDVTGPHAFPLRDPYAHLVHSARGSDVRHTVVHGKALLVDGKWKTLDAQRILAEARPTAEKIGKLLIN